MPEGDLRDLYDEGHRLLVECLVDRLRADTASPGDKALFAALMKQNNISVARVDPEAIQAMLRLQQQVAGKLQTFGTLEEKRRVIPLPLPPTA